jgi:hypothetical protein
MREVVVMGVFRLAIANVEGESEVQYKRALKVPLISLVLLTKITGANPG